MPKQVTAAEAMALVPDGATVATDGFTMMGVAEELLTELERRFLAEGHPRDLVVVHAAGQSNRVGGFEHFAHEGLVRRVIGSHWGLMPRMSAFLGADTAECVCLPQGQITALFRSIAARRPGHMTRVGLGTFVDPRHAGGKVNEAARRSSPDYVEVIDVAGEEYLLYKSFPIDVAVIRATAVDADGNCSQSEEGVWLDTISIAQAAHNSGGIVICQAKEIVPRGSIPPRAVTVPGCLVDYVVPCADPLSTHRQTDRTFFDARYITPTSESEVSGIPEMARERLVVGRRAIEFLAGGEVVNLGTGIPGDAIGPALAEAGRAGEVLLTLESGVYGGIPEGGVDFGLAVHPSAIVPQANQFDFYNGGGLDATFMGLGQVDAHGDVNVSALGGRRIGCGGFIDITQSAKRVYFCFTFSFDQKFPKFVPLVDEISFSAEQARRNGQQVFYICDKAVFRLGEECLELTEIAPGVDPGQLLAAIPFRVDVAAPLVEMDSALFRKQQSDEEVATV